jgi:hypothetical protein
MFSDERHALQENDPWEARSSPLEKGLHPYFKGSAKVPCPGRTTSTGRSTTTAPRSRRTAGRAGDHPDHHGPNPTKHETTKFTGTHCVEVYIVRDGVCGARVQIMHTA